MKQSLEAKLTQGPVMTPQLQQAIKLLTMPVQDLSTFVQNELLENPFLQADDGSDELDVVTDLAPGSETDVNEALDSQAMAEDLPLDYAWDNVYDSGFSPSSGGGGAALSEEGAVWEKTATAEGSLCDYLNEQLGLVCTDHTELFMGRYLVDAIDDAGYLRLDMAETAARLQVEKARLEEVLAVIQAFEPAGVGARDLAECLRLQMVQNDDLTPVAEVMLANLDLLARQDFERLARLAKCETAAVLEAAQDLTKCNPKPGLAYGSSAVDSVTPDAVVFEKNGRLEVELNAEALPKVLLNRTAQDVFTGANDAAKTYINERLSRGQWLIKSLEQRARTVLKVSRAIVRRQEDFFTYGLESLKPMTLKEIAEVVEVHESTVSRVTSGKYMQTPLGVFELKHFFSAGIGTTGGQVEVAAISVKAMIKRLIEAEDARRPLSDEKLVELLKAEGVDIARRTVAKYREALGLPASSGRRVR